MDLIFLVSHRDLKEFGYTKNKSGAYLIKNIDQYDEKEIHYRDLS